MTIYVNILELKIYTYMSCHFIDFLKSKNIATKPKMKVSYAIPYIHMKNSLIHVNQ
jgi:hypothetical protein